MRKSIFMVLLGLVLAAVPAFAVNSKPVRELIVSNAATGDGEYSSISAALASLPDPNPDTNPVVIKVMPGTYTENTLTMKSNVHLEGSGREVTTIQPLSASDTITLNGLVQVAISGFTIKGNSGSTGYVGPHAIRNTASSLSITENTILIDSNGILNENSSSTTIERNLFIGLSGGQACEEGISNVSSAPLITGNSFKGIGCVGIRNDSSSPTISVNTMENAGYGIMNSGSSPTISGNTIVAHPVYQYKGIYNQANSFPIITNNRITGHPYDIWNDSGATPNISSNVFDTIVGTLTGSFNVKSDGTPW